jgi:hypothetical protein
MKSGSLRLLFIIIPFFSFAQESTFQLKDYKYRTPGFQALFVNFGLSGSISDSKSSTGNDQSIKNFSLLPSNLTYKKVISTDRRLHYSSVSLIPDLYSNKEIMSNEERVYNTSSASFNWTRNDRYYKNSLWFIEWGNVLSMSGNRRRYSEPFQRTKENNVYLNNTVSIGIGKGRIEQVQDAQMALCILKDLQTQGLLDGEVTPAISNSFAQLITDINNRRVFDFRRRRIYELTRIDSFLNNSGLINKSDIRHFTTVNDDWAFAINPYRRHGTAWFARLKPSIGYSRSYSNIVNASNYENTRENTSVSLTPEIGFEKYVAVNLQWQYNMGASIAYEGIRYYTIQKNIAPNNNFEEKVNDYYSIASFSGFAGLGYFPNTRTQLGGTLTANVSNVDDNSFNFSPDLYLFANYFVGYRTYITAQGSIKYNDYNVGTAVHNKQLHINAGISISHILF